MNARIKNKVYRQFCKKHNLSEIPKRSGSDEGLMFDPWRGRKERRTELLSRLSRELSYSMDYYYQNYCGY